MILCLILPGRKPNIFEVGFEIIYLRQVFGQFGELIHVKIQVGKHCGFVQFAKFVSVGCQRILRVAGS